MSDKHEHSSTGPHGDGHGAHGGHGANILKIYYAVYAALMVLLVVTVAVSFKHFGNWNLPIAMSIATVKAVLVVLYFMHLADSPRLTWITAVSATIWIAILIVGIVIEYDSRRFRGEDPLAEGSPSRTVIEKIEILESAPALPDTHPH